MSKETATLAQTGTWRDIPQAVSPRAMSSEGRRRVVLRALRRILAGVVAVALAWCAWEMASVLRDNEAGMPDAAKSDRVRSLVLVTDGVLDKNWLARTLALRPDATLMGLDLERLRAKLLADPQVGSAALVRNFPDTLTVRISERSPVARIMAQAGAGAPVMLLVARDGTSFAGSGFDPAMVATLPWLDGVSLERAGGRLAPIAGMRAVSDLVACAKMEAENLYRTWSVISLARLGTDGEIEVHTRDGMRIIFGTKEDYLRQVARLDLLVDSAKDPTRPLRDINLSLGAQVPVAYGTAYPMLGGPPVNLEGAPAAASIAPPTVSVPRIELPHGL